MPAAADTTAAAAPGSVRSRATVATNCPLAASRAALSRPVPNTLARRSASTELTAAPMPLDAPVTSTLRPATDRAGATSSGLP